MKRSKLSISDGLCNCLKLYWTWTIWTIVYYIKNWDLLQLRNYSILVIVSNMQKLNRYVWLVKDWLISFFLKLFCFFWKEFVEVNINIDFCLHRFTYVIEFQRISFKLFVSVAIISSFTWSEEGFFLYSIDLLF